MNTIFNAHLDYVYFIYGLALVMTAIAARSLSRHEGTHLPWRWLGFFGLLHGLNEWLMIAALATPWKPFLAPIRLILACISFAALFEFGRRSLALTHKRVPGLWMTVAIALLSLPAVRLGLEGYSVALRYGWCLTGSVLACWALLAKSRHLPAGRSRSLEALAYTFAILAVIGGVFVQKVDFFPASVINGDTLTALTGVPNAVWRTIVACGSAYWMSEYLLSLPNPSTLIQVKSSGRSNRRWLVLSILALLVLGWFAVDSVGQIGHQINSLRAERAMQFASHHVHDVIDNAQRMSLSMSESPEIRHTFETHHLDDTCPGVKVLDRFAKMSPASVAYLLDETGKTIASSNRHEPDSFVGKSYAIRPYFQKAINGQHGQYFAIGITSKIPGHYSAHPVLGANGNIIGVVTLKIPIDRATIFGSQDATFALVNRDGMVLLSNDPALEQHPLWTLDAPAIDRIKTSKQFDRFDDSPILKTRPNDSRRVSMGADTATYWESPDVSGDWTIVGLDKAKTVEAMRGLTILIVGLVLLGTLLLVRNITQQTALINERSQMQTHLLHSEKLASIGTLAAGAAHEINNPLAIIKGYTDVLRRKLATVEGAQPFIETLNKQSQAIERIRAIVNGMRTVARTDTNDSRPVDLHVVIRDTMTFMGEIIRKSGVTVNLTLSAVNPTILGNAGKLQQVLMNLITNACDAMEKQSRARSITIETTSNDSSVTWSVSDTGPGIPEEVVGRIFDPFFTTKPVGKGTGLGLAISRTIIEEFKGSMTVSSRAELGTSFTISIPLQNNENAHAPGGSMKVSSANPPSLTGSVLLVEDEPELRNMIGAYLDSTGMTVTRVADGDEAARVIETQSFDYIISDIRLPGRDGVELVRLARSSATNKNARVVLMTGGSLADIAHERREIIHDQVDGYLSKPFESQQLIDILRGQRSTPA